MKSKQLLLTLGVIVSLVLLGACGPQGKQEKQEPAAPSITYDRQGLVDLMGKYLAALVKHDPSAVPFASKVKFTESTAEIPVGKGLWVTATGGPSEFQIYAADPAEQAVACLVMMKENGTKDILLGARLKTVDGKITEAEHLVIRDDLTRSLPNLQKPRPGLLENVPPSERMQRDQLAKIGLSYYDALTGEDGKLAPFANECERHENGGTTAGGKPAPQAQPAAKPAAKLDPQMEKMMKAMAAFPRTCEGQISTGTFAYITEIRNRRLVVADVQKGLAVGFSMFYHDSTLKETPIKGVPGIEKMPSWQGTFNLPAMHIYKIRNGKIYEIEAIGFSLPYGTKSGWE